MIRSRNRTHYVPHNKVTRLPRAFIYLDSEAVQHENRGSLLQTFRLAVTALDRRHHHKDGWKEREWHDWTDTDALWDWITDSCQPKARTVLVAHKLDYDLRITQALSALTKRGWKLENIRLDSTAAWAHWKKDTQTLIMCDSLSWVNMGLEKIGGVLCIPKLPLPDWEDSEESWFARCHRDVEIMATFYRRLIDWVRESDLGNWKPTGAGQAWAAYRHRFMTDYLLCHEDEAAREAERRAGWTGRCEAWQHGKIAKGPFYEWDYSTAYARIGAECKIPNRLIMEIQASQLDRIPALSKRYAILADCAVSTQRPLVPTRIAESIIWPVGQFATTLWDTEIDLLRINGAEVSINRAWAYSRVYGIRDFCRWCLGIIESKDTEVDPIVKLAVKHWSRALIGRFGSRWSEWEEVGRAPWNAISLGWAQDVGANEKWRIMQLGHQLFRQTEEMDSADAVPSVMTWIMAECRVRLWNAIETAGAENVCYMDTDSLIVNRDGHSRLAAAAIPGFRVKGQWNNLEIRGPRQLIMSGKLRAAGVPSNATRLDADTWEAETWAQFATSIASGEAGSVRITPRRVQVRGKDTRRIHGPHGTTTPIAV